MYHPNKIIFYTRPWEVEFHCRLASMLRKSFLEVNIEFVSFFRAAFDFSSSVGFKSYYVPDCLKENTGNQLSIERIKEIDLYFREKYIGLQGVLNTERFLPKERSEIERFAMQHLCFLDRIIVENTLSISSMYDHFFYLAAGLTAFEKGGCHFAFVGCGVPAGRVIGLKTPWEIWQNEQNGENAEELLLNAQREVLQPSEKRIPYMQIHKRVPKRSALERLRASLSRRRYARHDFKSGSYFPSHNRNWPLNALSFRLTNYINRTKFTFDWDLQNEADLSRVKRPFVFLALHMEPEATVLMYSPLLRDQIEAVRLVSECLPFGTQLVVKENPKMLGKRTRDFYAQIKSNVNVFLAGIGVSSSYLIERSSAVVSLGGTVSVEAMLFRKPSFCFGNPPFSMFCESTGFKLIKDLPRSLACSAAAPAPLQLDNWKKWIKATFVANSGRRVYSRSMGELVYDHSDQNTSRYRDYILSCVQNQKINEN